MIQTQPQPPPCARERTGPTGRTGSLPSASPPWPGPHGLLGPCPVSPPAHPRQALHPWLGLPGHPHPVLGLEAPICAGPGLRSQEGKLSPAAAVSLGEEAAPCEGLRPPAPGQSARGPGGRCVRQREREPFLSERSAGRGPWLVRTQARPSPARRTRARAPSPGAGRGHGAPEGVWDAAAAPPVSPAARVACIPARTPHAGQTL